MVRKKVDNRIRVLLENGVIAKHRSMYVIVGDKARDQVVILHHMLSKAVLKARPSVLWCYKKELGFSSHRKKRMRQLQKKIKTGKLDVNEEDPFELFVSSTNIRYCYYNETHKILGNTYGMCVLQDFEAMSPNLLARTIETVEGGGLVVFMLQSMDSLRQLCTLSMDVHARFRTEAHQDVVGRFNERFILSLASCKTCMVIDDQLNILPISSHINNIQPIPPQPMDAPLTGSALELNELRETLKDTQPVGAIINCCRTLDQAKAVLKFIDAISEKSLRSTAVMTAARGRGKSAALGLAMSTAVAFGYSNIFVTAPSPENLKTMFEFIFKGFDALEYQEHLDYELIQSTNPEFNKAIVRINIFREHRQTIQYIHPGDSHKLGQAELVCIDEAAAIPLPLVKKLLGPYLVFMSSTINGYEGTGRSLSLKLVQQLREQSCVTARAAKNGTKTDSTTFSSGGRALHEVSLKESIRYQDGDPVEKWLNELLCLDASVVKPISSGCPLPASCDLYYVNRDTLFSYHSASEEFLQRLMSLYVASHYKNTPNDLQLLSDAPAHHIFCLLGPVDQTSNALPEVLCVLQVCLEGEISKSHIMNSLSRGRRSAGDLIPWTVTQQFQDHDFAGLSGARVVRIATHPNYQAMGYGSRALEMLQKYYEAKIPSLAEDDGAPKEQIPVIDTETVSLLEEKLTPRKNLPPLLLKLSERRPERLDYMGVSYGLTAPLLRFWKKSGYTPVYLRQTPNELTGEHSCIMLKMLNQPDDNDDPEDEEEERKTEKESKWLVEYFKDFRRRFLALLSYQFSSFTPQMALNILNQKTMKMKDARMEGPELDMNLTRYDVKRMELYANNLVDYHLIMDLIPVTARLVFLSRLNVHLSVAQSAILLGLGLQHKNVETLEKEIDLPMNQLLALFNRAIRKIVHSVTAIHEQEVEKTMAERKEIVMEPLAKPMEQELEEAAAEVKAQHKEKEMMELKGLSQYAIQGTEADWKDALSIPGSKTIISVKSQLAKKRKLQDAEKASKSDKGNKHHKKHNKHGKK